MANGFYHINPETGDPGKCSAGQGHCPFGNDDTHYTSAESAREAFEIKSEIEKEKALTAWKRKVSPVKEPTASTVNAVSSHGFAFSGHGRPSASHGFTSSGHGR